jgi:hypothetical protein
LVTDAADAGSTDEDLGTLELINAELASRLSRQDLSLSRIETKATVVLGFAATAAQFLATRDPFRTPWSTLFGLVAFLVYAGAFAFGIWTLRVAKFDDLDPGELRQIATIDKMDALRQLIWARRAMFDTNKRKADRKADTWWWSFVLLTAGLLFSLACIMQTS